MKILISFLKALIPSLKRAPITVEPAHMPRRQWKESGPKTLSSDDSMVLYHKGDHWVLVTQDRHAVARRDAALPMHQAIAWANQILERISKEGTLGSGA